MLRTPEDEQGRSLVPQEPGRGLSPFEGQALTRAEERGIISSGFLLPVSREQGRNIIGFFQAASRALNDVSRLVNTTRGQNWRLLTGTQVRDVYDYVRVAQEAGLQILPVAAVEITRRQSMLTERLLRFVKMRDAEDESDWVGDIQKGATGGLSGQLTSVTSFLKEGYLSSQVAGAVPDETKRTINGLNEEICRRIFADLIRLCIPPRGQDFDHIDDSARILNDAIASVFDYSPQFAVELLKNWSSIIIASGEDTSEGLNRAFGQSAAFLLRKTFQPEHSQHFDSVRDVIYHSSTMSGDHEDTLFDMCVDELTPLASVPQNAVDLLREIGELELRVVNSELSDEEDEDNEERRGSFIYWNLLRKQQRVIFSMIRLALAHEGYDIDSLVEQFTESVTKEQQLAEFEDTINKRIRLTYEERTIMGFAPFRENAESQLEVPADQIADLVKERIVGELSPEEQEKFLAIGW